MNKIVTVTYLIGLLLLSFGEVDQFGPVNWWVRDNSANQGTHKYRGVCVISNSEIWVVGENGQVWHRTGGVHSPTWQFKSISGADAYHLNDVCFVGSLGLIVGEKIASPDKYKGVLYRSTNGGDDWNSMPTPPLPLPTSFLKVQMVQVGADYHGYISCGNGIILKTDDGGASWSRTVNDPWSNINNTSVWYGGLHVVDTTHLWVSGDAFGIMSKSTDGVKSSIFNFSFRMRV